MGARKAIEEMVTGPDRDDWLEIPITGVDGVPKTGQAWVTSGKLAATVIVPPSSGKAMRLMAEALWKGSSSVAEHIYTSPTAFPEIAKLTPKNPKG
jgi:ABC-type sugar transport system substrate-binding protein